MARKYLRTSDVARAVGVHPNTVRLYESWGFLPPAPRTASGYRMFEQRHVDQLRLARLAMRFTWLGGAIRQMTLAVVYRAAEGDLNAALRATYDLQDMIRSEQAYAHQAADVLERWAQGGETEEALPAPLTIGQAARFLGVTIDMLRSWERNGLIHAPRNRDNGYRQYGAVEISHLRVIRALRKAGYSLMAILRMTIALRQGQREDLKQVLDTPQPDEDVYYATDHLITTLAELRTVSGEMAALLEAMVERETA